MKFIAPSAIAALALLAAPLAAQEDDMGGDMGEVIVTAQRVSPAGMAAIAAKPPVIGLRRQADSAVRAITIESDSREEAMRRDEVQTMLLSAIDRAKASGMVLVTGQFELVEVTRKNWRDQFPGLAGEAIVEEDDDDNDDEVAAAPAFEDDGSTTTIRLRLKTRLDGSVDTAHQKIDRFIKSVPAAGRAQIKPRGGLALTIVNPGQYRDQIYALVAAGAKHAQGFYGPDHGLEVTGLGEEVAWKQVSNTEVFLYLPYNFTVRTR